MFTNEKLDNLLTMYKDNYLEGKKLGGKVIYSTILRDYELMSIRKDLMKEGDKLVISDKETLTFIKIVGVVVKTRCLVPYRDKFPNQFMERLSKSDVYLSGVGRPIDVGNLVFYLRALRGNVLGWKKHNIGKLIVSEEIVKERYAEDLGYANLSVDGDHLVTLKYREEVDYILGTDYNPNFYKLVTSDELVLKLLSEKTINDYTVSKVLEGFKGGLFLMTAALKETISSYKKANLIDNQISSLSFETKEINKAEVPAKVKVIVADSERILQGILEMDMGKLSKGTHYAKFERLANGECLNSKSESYYFEDRFNSKEHEVLKELLNKVYRSDLLVDNKLTFDIELYVNEAMRKYKELINQNLRDKDYYGILIGDSEDKLNFGEAKALNDMVETLNEFVVAVYEKEDKLA